MSDKANYKNKNADIFELSDIISCKKRIEAEKEEVKYKDSQGETRSFTPQFFAYKFNFYIDIRVKNTEYNTISIKLNDKVIDNDQETLIKMNSSGLVDILRDALKGRAFDGMRTNNMDEITQSFEYKRFDEMADQIVNCLMNLRNREKIVRCPYCGSRISNRMTQCDRCGANL